MSKMSTKKKGYPKIPSLPVMSSPGANRLTTEVQYYKVIPIDFAL